MMLAMLNLSRRPLLTAAGPGDVTAIVTSLDVMVTSLAAWSPSDSGWLDICVPAEGNEKAVGNT